MSLTSGPTGPRLPIGKVIIRFNKNFIESGGIEYPCLSNKEWEDSDFVTFRIKLTGKDGTTIAVPVESIPATDRRVGFPKTGDPIIHPKHGTITDPQPGISASFGYTVKEISGIIYFIDNNGIITGTNLNTADVIVGFDTSGTYTDPGSGVTFDIVSSIDNKEHK